MLSGIRGRLLLSYILLLVVTLSVTAGTVILLLSSRPAPPEQTYRELLTFARSIDVRSSDFAPIRRRLTGTDTTFLDNLKVYAAEFDVRVLVVNMQNQIVIDDSAGAFASGDTFRFRLDPTLPPMRGGQGSEIAPNYVSGAFQDVDGSPWLFVGVGGGQRSTQLGSGLALLISQQQPTTSLITAISQFGSELSSAILQAAAVGLIVAGGLAVVITRTIAYPLRMMATAAGAVAEGDYSQRVPEQGPKEIGEVASAFNRMSQQVELNNQAQRELLANVSHDLKTPLTSIQGFSQAIMDGTAPDPSRAAAVIFDEAGRLTRLVSQLTELARLKSGRLDMRQDKLNIAEIVEAMVQKIDVVAQKKEIRLFTDIAPVPNINGDGDRLAQVVSNLLTNAVKYTPKGGEVHARVQKNGSGVNIVVQDNGIGIPKEDISRIFERFYQVDKSRGPQRGYGLGLAITHEIVLAHGGQITVDSPGEGKGSVFTVWLPTAA